MKALIAEALRRWNMVGADSVFVTGRENQVFKLSGPAGIFALRVRRPGLRNIAEIESELAWLDALDQAGLPVPRPHASTKGAMLEHIDGYAVDMVGWLPGAPVGQSRNPLQLDDPVGVFHAVGRAMAGLHIASDAFQEPAGFSRVRWDRAGLLGDDPVWGRFWENPTLDASMRSLLGMFRKTANMDLAQHEATLDYGLIHADLVRENLLHESGQINLIDFDDGGYGFRLFDVATALLKNRKEPHYADLKAALCEGYLSVRPLDMQLLDLFVALRAVTYVGWVITRMNEPGAPIRNDTFIKDARECCEAYLG